MPRKSAKKSTATYEDGDEPNRCRAANKSNGKRCGRPKEEGFEVCYRHGARGGAPIKTGKYSTKLGRFREDYERARDDDALFDLRDTVALLDVRVARAAEKASALDSPEYREEALRLWREARDAGTPEAMRLALGKLGTLLEGGVEEDKALEELARVAERLAVRQEAALKIQLAAASAVREQELNALIAVIHSCIVEELDGKSAQRLLTRLDQTILGGHPRQAALPPPGE